MEQKTAICEIADKMLRIPSVFGIRTIDPDDLLYAEVCRRETSFVLAGERIDSTVPIDTVQLLLPPNGFYRIHRSYLVSLKKITFIGRESVTMENGDSIPFSEARKKEFLEAYQQFMEESPKQM